MTEKSNSDVWVFKSEYEKQRYVYRLLEDYTLPNGGTLQKGLVIEFMYNFPPKHLRHILKQEYRQNNINGTVWNEYPPVDILIWRNWIVSRTPFYTNERLD